MKRHLLILLLITVLVRGWLFLSYPLGGVDDDQSAERYLIDELVKGNLYVGNLRYQTGYPFFIAPVVTLSQVAGRLNDRIILLVQIAFSAAIPFLLYDIVRSQRNEREAIIVAMVSALDPFGLQWAHTSLPVWLVAFCITLALWFTHRALLTRKRIPLWITAAGLTLGLGCLARSEVTVLTAALGFAFLAFRTLSLRLRFMMFAVLGGASLAVWVIYLVLIQIPSTGTWRPSCMAGIDGLLSTFNLGASVTAANGPASAEVLRLMALKSPKQILLLSDTYPNWRIPGPWATAEEQATFFNQPPQPPDSALTISIPENLIYYMGPCPTDDLLRQVHYEAMRAYPERWIIGMPIVVTRMLLHLPTSGQNMYLPGYNTVQFQTVDSQIADTLGFRKAYGDFFTGQVVWSPGIWLFSNLFKVLNAIHLLAPLAVIWAVWMRHWLYTTVAAIILLFLLAISFLNVAQPRIYASVYPLADLLIGGFIAVVLSWLLSKIASRRASGTT